MVANLVTIPLFAGLQRSDIEVLGRSTKRQSFEAGEVIFSQGDPGDGLYLIESGIVSISITGGTGQRVTLVVLHPGEFFGELSLFDGQPRSATASAMEPTVTLHVGKERFLRFLEERPRASFALLKVLSQRLRQTDELVGDALFLNIAERLAKKLVGLGESLGDATPSGIMVRLRRGYREVAEMAGLDQETTRRWLTRFQHRGLIKMERGRIILLRPEDLRRGALEPEFAEDPSGGRWLVGGSGRGGGVGQAEDSEA